MTSARVSTSFASGTTSAQASAGTTGSPTAARHSASFTSLPTYAVSASENPRRSSSSRRAGSLSSIPRTHSLRIFRARAGTASFVSAVRMKYSTPTSSSRRSPCESPRKHATLSSPRSFVQTRLSEKTPSKSKTTSRISARPVTPRERRRAARRARRPPARPPARRSAGAARRRPSSSSSSYGGSPPSAGDFATRSPGPSTCPAGKSRAATSFFPIFSSGRSSLWQRSLHAVSERVGHAAQVTDEPAHSLGHERERMVGALPRVIQGEVLLDDARAEHVADQRHRDAALVVGEADDELRESARGTSR